jgi:hypothetical protein
MRGDPGPPHYLISIDLGLAPVRTCLSVCELHGTRPMVELHVRELLRPEPGAKVSDVITLTRAVHERIGTHLERTYAYWADPDILRRGIARSWST